MGAGPGKTTGWVHRAALNKHGVKMLAGVEYVKVDDEGLHLRHGGEARVLKVDSIIICAGQEPVRELASTDDARFHLIGGAKVASELDAKRAIREGAEVGAAL